VSFFIADDMYGLDIRIVKEVNPNIRISDVPLSKNTIRGLVNIRGQIVLVMDIAILFGNEPRPITDASQLVILKTAQEIQHLSLVEDALNTELFGDKPIAFLVDCIGDVITIPEKTIEPTPPHIDETHSLFIKGVTKIEDALFTILNAEEMISA
jgi:purine-binding chemotaxis protein CheW